jgi:Cu/Ag efflux protein CusF
MRKLMVAGAALVAGALALQGAAAQQQGSGMKVTGIVTSTDEDAHKITIGDQTFVMPEQGGTALFPQAGDEVTLFYEEQGNEKVITRIGQPQN